MIKHDININKLLLSWLTITIILVFFTIIIGGLTRLTNSGLSITEWELFKGILPPMTQTAWNNYFDLYKKIPQFQLLNNTMDLAEFKIIFYWEYAHRILARLIGIFFIIPLVYFYLSKKITKNYMNTCYVVLGLIIFQGIVGWYMVKSGLVNNITVSHYRLSLHLITALSIISIIFWLILNIKNNTQINFFNFSFENTPYLILIFLIFIQIILGAFVSGLDAGQLYQTWPLMGYSFFPDDLDYGALKTFFDFDSHSMVQFYHRNMAYFISVYMIVLSFTIFKKKYRNLYQSLVIMITILFLQIFLGICTLISGLNIFLASAHQITSVLLVFSTIYLYYSKVK